MSLWQTANSLLCYIRKCHQQIKKHDLSPLFNTSEAICRSEPCPDLSSVVENRKGHTAGGLVSGNEGNKEHTAYKEGLTELGQFSLKKSLRMGILSICINT